MHRFVAGQRDRDARWFVIDLYLGKVVWVAPTEATNTERAADGLAERFEQIHA